MFRTYCPGPAPAALSAGTVHGIRTAWLLIVMPRSRSMSIRSRYCARALRSSTTPVSCSIRSASVDLPWSMCAMMQKFRMIAGSVLPGWAEGCEDTPLIVPYRYPSAKRDGGRGTRRPPSYTMSAMTSTAAGPRGHLGLEPVPHGSTARRLDWLLLPPMLRRLVETRLGTPVVTAVSAGAGGTPRRGAGLTG